jgi:hypothetical protein
VIDRILEGKAERARFLKQLQDEAPAWLQARWAASRRRGTDKLTMRQIDVVAAARRKRVKKLIVSCLMIRVVLDTNVIVSALLVPTGQEASVSLLGPAGSGWQPQQPSRPPPACLPPTLGRSPSPPPSS